MNRYPILMFFPASDREQAYVGVPVNGELLRVDEPDLEILLRFPVCLSRSKTCCYALVSLGGGTVYLHRLLTGAEDGFDVDHINGDGLDNRRSNLRVCSRKQNIANKRKTRSAATSRFKGVSLSSRDGRWHVQIKVNNRGRFLGSFADESEAARRYDDAARELFGEFACLNFPRPGEQGALSQRPEPCRHDVAEKRPTAP